MTIEDKAAELLDYHRGMLVGIENAVRQLGIASPDWNGPNQGLDDSAYEAGVLTGEEETLKYLAPQPFPTGSPCGGCPSKNNCDK